jgi:CzcA family heavy metal efflux pump
MLAAIVRVSLANPRIVAALAALITMIGASALINARFDVFPDFAPPFVVVQIEAPGLSAPQVEARVTRPIEDLLAGTENVSKIRSTSTQGLAAIRVIFHRGSDPYRQRQAVIERLSEAGALLPEGVHAPQLSPLSSSMEYLLHFGYTSDTLSSLELRDIVQWSLKPQILGVPGVAHVQLFGGEARERRVAVDAHKLAAAGLTLDDIVEAIRRATAQTGGGYIETDVQRLVVQVEAAGSSADALAAAIIDIVDGVPRRLGDVASVIDGAQPQFGDATIAGKPGILVETSSQYGANTLEATRALEARLEALAPALAAQGVDYHPALLRPASFIENAIGKMRRSLLIGAALVVILLLVMLRDWRGALVSFSAIPLALLAAVWVLSAFGFSLNTMTLGGLIVALGVVVDDAVIDVENILRRRRESNSGVDIDALFNAASLEVRRPVFYATAAVAVAFLPILTMSGLQGAFFSPLSIAFLLAVGLSLLVALAVTPALCMLFMREHAPKPEAAFLQRCKRAQLSAIGVLAKRPRLTITLLVVTGIAGIVLLPLFGARLLPDFRENYLIAHSRLRAGIAIVETARIGREISERLVAIPGVRSVAQQIGRAENGQDTDTPNESEFELRIEPTSKRSAEAIEADIRAVFDSYPNQQSEVYSVLAERIGETLTGEGSAFSVSVFGNDLDEDDRVAAEIAEIVGRIPGADGVRLVVPPRQPQVRVELDPDALLLHGLAASDVLQTVQAAFHGTVATEMNLADRSLPVVVRIADVIAAPEAVSNLLLRGRDGALVTLGQVAHVGMQNARSEVDHEDGLRRQIVVATPDVADQVGFARRAQQAIAEQVALPPGIYLRYGGAAEAQREATRELVLHSAFAFVLVVLLLALAYGRARHVMLTLAALPSTLIGGVTALWLTGSTLSLGSMVGFVALFGMAARNTILLISHYDHLVQVEGEPWNLATALRGAAERLTPVLLTALLTALALLPVALQSKEAGHEIEGPMAIVLLGGLVTSTLVSLLLIPPLAARWLRIRQIAGTD